MCKLLGVVILLAFAPVAVHANDPMQCDVGPVERQIGGTDWLIYSCADGRSVVVVANSGNPAQPFYFMLFPEGDTYRLYGEGTGKKEATQAAYDELAAALSAEFVESLIAATQNVINDSKKAQ